MNWGSFVVIGSAALAVGVAVRLLAPVDISLNRYRMTRILRETGRLQQDRVKRMQVQRVDVAASREQNMERIFYRLSMETDKGLSLSCLAQVFYPLAALFEERARQRKSLVEQEHENYNPYSISPSAWAEMPTAPEGDPIKNEQEEADVKNRKIARLQAEVEQLRLLNQVSKLYPTLVHFDGFRLITVTDDIGTVRLDQFLAGVPARRRPGILKECVMQLAEAHETGRVVTTQLLPGLRHTEAVLNQFVELGLSMWSKQRVPLTNSRLLDLKAALAPLTHELVRGEQGLKTGEATPRSFYWDGNSIRQLDWGRARQDLLCLDLVELVCDPAADLSLDDELSLFSLYCEYRGLAEDWGRDVDYSAIIYRITLSGYICQYLEHEHQMTGEQKKELGGVNWDREHLARIWGKLLGHIAMRPELARLSNLMQELNLTRNN